MDINATVVQFGLGHQIANLVTRVQIPAVALAILNYRYNSWFVSLEGLDLAIDNNIATFLICLSEHNNIILKINEKYVVWQRHRGN